MSVKRSKISWTDFSSGDLNFVLRGSAPGDCETSPGCAHCYAASILRRSGATGKETTYSEEKLKRLLKAEFPAPAYTCEGDDCFRRGPGSRPMAFVCDMGDLFHDSVPWEFIERALAILSHRTDVDWQVLTKRAERAAVVLEEIDLMPNIWFGITAENQEQADKRTRYLRTISAAIRFLSIEPMLEYIDLSRYLWRCECGEEPDPVSPDWRFNGRRWEHHHISVGNVETTIPTRAFNWVICGGESGDNRRPFDMDWARSLRDQCRMARVPFFFKQGSDRYPGRDDLLDGEYIKEFPEVPHA